MRKNIIEVDNLSKLYRLGDISSGTISHDLNRWWAKIRGKEDPLQKIGETNDRTLTGDSDYVWSLRNISFSIPEGEVFGIVGRNGSGKSTLLKILSKITRPTKGTVRIGGRIASLLEVGTGFHPDLSGRENIFLNGAVLGMKKAEIRAKFDEIVDFSGVSRYIDTPIKRYSSGMYVRLAFAVAAHLEPDILIVDEVLAVGDAEFQQKCLGKMRHVSRAEGRTVLFVSHNLSAVKKLCTTGLLLDKGHMLLNDRMEKVLEMYQYQDGERGTGKRQDIPYDSRGYFTDWALADRRNEQMHTCYSGEMISIQLGFTALSKFSSAELHVIFYYDDDQMLLHASTGALQELSLEPGVHVITLTLSLPVCSGLYRIEAGLRSTGVWVDMWRPETRLRVIETMEETSLDGVKGLLKIKNTFGHKVLRLTSDPVPNPTL
jgi:lipopolysaccharide transport system ATP-binding protein